VTELGGMVIARPFDVPGVGRIAMVHGPAHESFGIFASSPQA
jgi:predicted enzyme related to lactoylglutathione lyase